MVNPQDVVHFIEQAKGERPASDLSHSKRSFDCRRCTDQIEEPVFGVGFKNCAIFTLLPEIVGADGLRVAPRSFDCTYCKNTCTVIARKDGRALASHLSFGSGLFWLCAKCTLQMARHVGISIGDVSRSVPSKSWLCPPCTAATLKLLNLTWEEAAAI